MTRRERLAGFKYLARGRIPAEVRKACRDELKILYTGGPFGSDVWERLSTLGDVNVFEASKLNAKMKDIVRIRAAGVRVEGARDGELIVAFFAEGSRRQRHRIEALIIG